MKDAMVRRLSRLHRVLFRATGGSIGRRLVRNDMLLLTTTGRKTGRKHTVPLLYLEDAGTLVVIASYGGRPHNPQWYRNLADEPRVTVQLGLSRKPYRARTADSSERSVWWPRVIAAYPGYQVYQSRTNREIRIVFLDPEHAG